MFRFDASGSSGPQVDRLYLLCLFAKDREVRRNVCHYMSSTNFVVQYSRILRKLAFRFFWTTSIRCRSMTREQLLEALTARGKEADDSLETAELVYLTTTFSEDIFCSCRDKQEQVGCFASYYVCIFEKIWSVAPTHTSQRADDKGLSQSN